MPGPQISTDSHITVAADRVLSAALTTGVLVQAVLAGRSSRLFGTIDITVHGTVGNAIFALALAQVALLVRGRQRRLRVVVAAAFLAGVAAQIGIGYAGRDSVDAAAWHVPFGVALFGISVWNLILTIEDRTTTPSRRNRR